MTKQNIELRSGEETHLTFRLTRVRMGTIKGVVAGRDGKPIRRATVGIMPEMEQESCAYPSIRPDANGRFSIGGLAPGRYRVTASRITSGVDIRLPRSAEEEVELEEGAILEVRLVPEDPKERAATRLTGRVADERGAPVRRAWVSVTDPPGYVKTQTDRDGMYTLAGLSHGVNRLWISGPRTGDLLSTEDETTVETGQTVTRDHTLVQGGRIEGAVTDEKGQALTGADVRCTDGKWRGCCADGRGRYSLLLPPGTHRVRAWDKRGSGTKVEKTMTVLKGKTVHLDFTLPKR